METKTVTFRLSNAARADMEAHLLPGESMTKFLEYGISLVCKERAEYGAAVKKALEKVRQ